MRTGPLPAGPLAQRGQTIFFAAIFLLLGISATIYAMLGTASMTVANKHAADDARTLVEVKNALLAWSAARTPTVASPNIRPGELPCPDTDNTGTDSGSCVAGAIGRVPWKSLNIPEPRDSAGETLWYAIAGPFRNHNMSSTPITSDTQGNLTVYQGSSATTLTSQAIAVIFAPGAALATQNRSATDTATCATTGTLKARNLCATNYLEALGGGNNAQTGGPFIQAQSSSTSFNDRVLAITNVDLMPVVEQRVAREMISYLNSYRALTGVYPWADLGDGNSNNGLFTNAYNRNRFPCNTAEPTHWGSSGTPTLPNWLTNGCLTGSPVSGWSAVIYYAAARNRLEDSGAGCTTCTASSLSVTNSTGSVAIQCTTSSPPVCVPAVVTTGNADLVLMTAGGYTGSPARSWSQSAWSAISGYFVDTNAAVSSENRDNVDDNFYVPSTASNNRARMYIVR